MVAQNNNTMQRTVALFPSRSKEKYSSKFFENRLLTRNNIDTTISIFFEKTPTKVFRRNVLLLPWAVILRNLPLFLESTISFFLIFSIDC